MGTNFLYYKLKEERGCRRPYIKDREFLVPILPILPNLYSAPTPRWRWHDLHLWLCTLRDYKAIFVTFTGLAEVNIKLDFDVADFAKDSGGAAELATEPSRILRPIFMLQQVPLAAFPHCLC